ncbi:MAG: hypothetical protein EOO05_02770 [Chitinophagaceae bacterium]|nr:MAG: hypothetical protein EOO05_02770 [Chitinophagaceae bacterium]
MTTTIYPAGPVSVDPGKLAPSSSFRKNVSAVISSIVLFFVVYLILVIAAVALAVACFYGGIALIVALPKLLTIVAGLGMMGVGVSVIFFLVKFIFSVSRMENAGRVEIHEADQPRLFAFIRRLSEETKTPFPKKIFLSPDVNACVFYNSSFWSMFFPVRKNLEIGVGLVNAVNISEFKAIIAHEFGHFSQRSMKLGSFTYNVNRVIFNMLYENKSYGRFLESWGRIDGLLSIFAVITAKIAQGIQSILRHSYQSINKNYMGLSRQMEFHADAIAASVAGGNNIVSGLSRVEVAQGCYNSAVENAYDWVKEQKISTNIFNDQRVVLGFMAEKHGLAIRGGLPVVDLQFIQNFSKSRVNYLDQWASHPTLADRKKNVEALELEVPADETLAWSVFDNAEELQRQFTHKFYETVTIEMPAKPVADDEFHQLFYSRIEEQKMPDVYNGFYTDRYVDPSKWSYQHTTATPTATPETIFTEINTQLIKSVSNNQQDLDILKAIAEKQIDVKSFDFDGIKYPSEEAAQVVAQLEKEIESQQKEIDGLDLQAFEYYRSLKGERLVEDYQAYGRLVQEHQDYITTAGKVLERLFPLYHDVTLESAEQVVRSLKAEEEPAFKKVLQLALDRGVISNNQPTLLADEARGFLSKYYEYLIGTDFQQHELQAITRLAIEVGNDWEKMKFRRHRELLASQLEVSPAA